jgi:hypothetical protein
MTTIFETLHENHIIFENHTINIIIDNLVNKSNDITIEKIISNTVKTSDTITSAKSTGPTLSQAEKAKSSSHSESDRSGGSSSCGWCQSDRSGSWDHGGGGRSFSGCRDR